MEEFSLSLVKYGGKNMNEVLKVISERYSCRSFTGEAVEKEKIGYCFSWCASA